MISISIGVLILTTVVGGQARYNDGASLKSAANDLSLLIRQAQVYGISVKGTGAANNDFSSAFGVSFHVAYLDSYVSFVDKLAPFGTYDAINFTNCGTSVECLNINLFGRGNKIVNPMCRIASVTNQETCDVGRADVVFRRPATEALITYFDNISGAVIPSSNIKGLRVKLVSPRGAERSVYVYSSGLISVQ